MLEGKDNDRLNDLALKNLRRLMNPTYKSKPSISTIIIKRNAQYDIVFLANL